MKSHTDSKRHATPSHIQLGDTVLVRQPKLTKFMTLFDPTPLTVVAINGSMVTAQRTNKRVAMNISHFKKFYSTVMQGDSPTGPRTSEEEFEDDDDDDDDMEP